MRCDDCDLDLEPNARFCPSCGRALAQTVTEASEAERTTAWARQTTSEDERLADASDVIALDVPSTPRVLRWVAVVTVLVCVAAAGLAIWISTRGGRRPGAPEVAGASRAAVERTAPAAQPKPQASPPPAPEEKWWTPPGGKRESVEALAYAFTNIDEHDLGRVFDAELQPVYGAPPLFEDHAPRRLPRHEMFHSLIALRDTMQLTAGFSFLFIQLGASQTSTHDYQLYRAMDIDDVLSVDETKRMREPPPGAVFYLAEIHRGASYDMLIEGDYADMGGQLSLAFTEANGSAGALQSSGRYRVYQRGLGLRPTSGDAIFAMSPAEVAARYASSGEAVPVRLVFRTIPGRTYAHQEIPAPRAVIDTSMYEEEGKAWTWKIPTAATYRLVVRSQPKGAGVSWDGSVYCDPPISGGAYTSLTSTCTVASGSSLTVENPTTFGAGPTERVTVYLATEPAAVPSDDGFGDEGIDTGVDEPGAGQDPTW